MLLCSVMILFVCLFQFSFQHCLVTCNQCALTSSPHFMLQVTLFVSQVFIFVISFFRCKVKVDCFIKLTTPGSKVIFVFSLFWFYLLSGKKHSHKLKSPRSSSEFSSCHCEALTDNKVCMYTLLRCLSTFWFHFLLWKMTSWWYCSCNKTLHIKALDYQWRVC